MERSEQASSEHPAQRRAGRKRRCGECGRWCLPDPRVGARQCTCGAAACRRKRKQRTQRRWTKRNRGYWAERRFREQVERARQAQETGAPAVGSPPPGLGEVGAVLAQAEIAPQVLVLATFLSRLAYRAAQAEMTAQVAQVKGELRRLAALWPQAETDNPAAPG